MLVEALQPLFSKFDKLENRFDKLENRFDKLENRFNTYVKTEADIVEFDIRQNIERYFQEKYHTNKLQRYDSKLKKMSKPNSNDTMTEFDGLYVLSIPGVPDNDVPSHRIFVLIEAKRHVTMAHVTSKLAQHTCLQEAIGHAQNPGNKKLCKKYLQTLKTHKFSEIKDVMLYIGGRVWNDDALEAIKERVCEQRLRHRTYANALREREREEYPMSSIGYVTASQTSYDVVDGQHPLPTMNGGKRPKRSSS
jgi:hypothetical protein